MIEQLVDATVTSDIHILNSGLTWTCAGDIDPDGNVTNRHIIGHLTETISPDNDNDDSVFAFADGMSLADPSHPVCSTCGKPVGLH